MPTIYAYDRNGNLTSTTQNNQVTASYEYDGRDQLRRVLGGNSQEVAGYDYDFERHRVAKTVGSQSLTYVYGGDKVVNEYGANNQLLNRYDIGAGEIVRAELGGEGERYYFSDGQGSVTSLAQLTQSPPASLTARYEYDAWGNYLTASGGSYNSIGYTGQRVDGETGLMPLGNGERYYSPGSGRFIQQDSFTGMAAMAQSMNRYAYAHNNPLRFTDPSGHTVSESVELFGDYAIGVGEGIVQAVVGTAKLGYGLGTHPIDTLSEVGSGLKHWGGELHDVAKEPLVAADVLADIVLTDPKGSMRTMGNAGGQVIGAEIIGEVAAPVLRSVLAPVRAATARIAGQAATRFGETLVGRATAGAVREGVTMARATLEPLTQTVRQGIREAGEAVNPLNYRVNPNRMGMGFGSLERIVKGAAKDIVEGDSTLSTAKFGEYSELEAATTHGAGQTTLEYNIAPHRMQPRPSKPYASHHGIQRKYLENNVPGYDAEVDPTIMLDDVAGGSHRKITGEQATERAAIRRATGEPYGGDYGEWRARAIDQMQRNGVPEGKIGQWVLEHDGYMFEIGKGEP